MCKASAAAVRRPGVMTAAIFYFCSAKMKINTNMAYYCSLTTMAAFTTKAYAFASKAHAFASFVGNQRWSSLHYFSTRPSALIGTDGNLLNLDNNFLLASAKMSTKADTISDALVPSTSTSSPVESSSASTDSSSIYVQDAEGLASLKSPFLQTLRDRGFLHQCTNIQELDNMLYDSTSNSSGPNSAVVSAYLGFDATADSLHVGSLLQIMILRHFQRCGHKPIVLIGGGTSKVGDPTGKDESRKLMDEETIEYNKRGISSVFQKFLTFEDVMDQNSTNAYMVDNDDWLSQLKYLEFLRDYGTHFTINRMLSFESVKQRLSREAPLSFLEFNYMILQAYDFLELNRRFGVRLQLGGADQWGNIISGIELGRRCSSNGAQLFGLTAPLITTADGKKMGKTEGGAMWLNADKLSEYDYWQFWRNTADQDVIRFLKLFTEISLERIHELETLDGADINKAKIILADEATALLHGVDCLKAIHETIKSMFGKGGGESLDSLPRIFLTAEALSEGTARFADLFVKLGFATSKKDAKRLIAGGGARIGEEKILDENGALCSKDFVSTNEVVLRAGKKRAGVVELK
jgi:tyrosyl-tRNA synthetase